MLISSYLTDVSIKFHEENLDILDFEEQQTEESENIGKLTIDLKR